MPDHFDTDDARSLAFDRCLAPLFPQVMLESISGNLAGRLDRTYEIDGVAYILREVKLEANKSYPYMQVVRAYQLHAEKVLRTNAKLAKEGVPVFLLCLLGKRGILTRVCMF